MLRATWQSLLVRLRRRHLPRLSGPPGIFMAAMRV
jgi:hypothetical protein